MNTLDTYAAELDYRSNRIRRDVGRNRGRVRIPFVRRPAEAARPTAR